MGGGRDQEVPPTFEKIENIHCMYAIDCSCWLVTLCLSIIIKFSYLPWSSTETDLDIADLRGGNIRASMPCTPATTCKY